jgi:hypothetical protein
MRRDPTVAPLDREAVEKVIRAFVTGICRRRTMGASREADQRACRNLARRLVARDSRLADRLHYTLGLDRVGIDLDDETVYTVANALAIVVADTWHILRRLDVTGDIKAARYALDAVVRNWTELVAGIPGAIRPLPGS